MSVVAVPDDLLAGVRAHVLRSKLVTAVPLGSKVRPESCEIGDAGDSALASAVRATRTAFRAVGDTCLPPVAASTGPPDSLGRARADLTRRQFAVSFVVPLGRQIGMESGEVGFAWDCAIASAIRTAGSIAGSIVDGGDPPVPPGRISS